MIFFRCLNHLGGARKNNAPGQIRTGSGRPLAYPKAPDRIFGSTLMHRAYRSMRRNGIKSFFLKSAVFHLQRYLCRIKIFVVYGFDLFSPFDNQWPDKNRFLPLKPFSLSCRQGKPSLCLVTYHMSSGGAERQVAGLACALKKLGYDVRVRVLCLDGEFGHYLPYLKANGVDIAVPEMPGLSGIQFMKQQGVDISLIQHLPEEIRIGAIALTRELLCRPVDIVHCYLDTCCCHGGFAALLSGIPMIRFSWRNVNPTHFDSDKKWLPDLYRFFLQFSHIKLESNTSAGASDYANWLGLPSEKVEVIPNGVDALWLGFSNKPSGDGLRQAIGIAPDAPLVVSMSRLVPKKRPLDLPGILLALRKNIPEAILVHIGEGPLKTDLQELIASTAFKDPSGGQSTDTGMFLLGRQERVFEILRVSDVFLHTSAYEGMPNAVMEAMLAGLPVVSTRVGGVPDLIEDGVHGYLHEVGDIGGMSRSLEKLLGDPVLRKKMGSAGQERIASEFTVNHLTKRLTRAYRV